MNLHDMQATVSIEDDNLTIGVPFCKVDVKNRTVEGFATLNNEDKAGDIVDHDASLSAFSNWPGNVREMHQKVAVGKALSVTPKEYTDPDTGETYDGLWVKARISKGAQDTWEKVLDGTLTGFSIGGAILEKRQELSKASGRAVHRITNYRLNELSVVDNPCNQLSTIALVKDISGTDVLADGEVVLQIPESLKEVEKMEVNIENDDLHKAAAKNATETEMGAHDPKACGLTTTDHIVKSAKHLDAAASHASASGDHYTAADAHNVIGQVHGLARAARNRDAVIPTDMAPAAQPSVQKGVDSLQNNNNSDNSDTTVISSEDKNLVQKFLEFVKSNNQPEPKLETKPEPKVEEITKDGDTPEMNEETLTKALGEMTDNIAKVLSDKFGEFGTKVEEVEKRFDSVATTDLVDELKKSIDEVVGRVTALEGSGAIQKSAEAAGAEKLEKSAGGEGLWADAIVPSILKDRFSGSN